MRGGERKKGWLYSIVFFLLLAFVLPAELPAAAKARVKVERAVIRSGPGVDNAMIGRVVQGTVLEIIGRSGSWYRVVLPVDLKSKDRSGYIPEYMIEVLAEETPAPRLRPAGVRPKTLPVIAKQSQGALEINLLGGGGYTIVDVAKDLDVPQDWLGDWTMVNWRILAQALWPIGSGFKVGGEFGFTNFYYYYWQAPAYSWGHSGHPQALNLHLVADYHFAGQFFMQGGAGVFFFKSVGFGLFSALGGDIPISPRMAIPVMVRFDLIPGGPSPLTLLLGLKFKL